ncbi:MAG: HRDC domain-containing protein [Candidatus Lustribacter sp.]
MNVDLVTDPTALAALCARIEAAPRIGLDTEFHTEKHFTPKLMVVQVAFDDAVAIVDPLALPDLRPLAEALTRATVVGHALSSDLRILEDAFGVLPGDAYDTQLAAAFCGYGMSISLLDLVRDVAGVTLLKSQTVSDWSTRPFTPRQLDYLVDDVRYLFAVADRLNAKLIVRGRDEWVREEMRALIDPRTYRTDKRRLYLRVAGNARMNRRELGILNELALLRETIARERNIPLKYVLPDDVLVGLVGLRPQTVEELSQLRRLDAGMRKHIGTRIISAVAAGEAIPEDALPPRAPRPLGAQRDALVAAIALLINAVAAANELPAALLVSRAEIERIARDLPQSPAELAALLDLTPWRWDLVVGPLWEFLSGERVLRIAGYRDGSPRTTWETRLEESLVSE